MRPCVASSVPPCSVARSIRCSAARRSRTRAFSRFSTPSSTYLPSPADREAIEGIDFKTEEPIIRRPTDEDAFSMLAFKIMDDPFVGTITFCRVYSGKVETGARS